MKRACVLATTDVLLPSDIPLGSEFDTGFSSGSNDKPRRQDEESPEALQNSSSVVPKTENPRPTLEQAAAVLFEAAEQDPEMEMLQWLEKEAIRFAMSRFEGNQAKAAKLLGITRTTLRKRLERFSIH